MSGGVVDLDKAVAALQRLLTDPEAPALPPPELRAHPGLADLYRELAAVRSHLRHISHGDLSHPIRERGVLSGYLKSLQAELRHLTWQTQMIAAGDFSQRVEFLGEFSTAFNAMTEALAKATAELAQSEARYRLLAENVADVIITLDAAGRFTYISPSVCRLTGYTPDELVGRRLPEVTNLQCAPRPGAVVELLIRCKDATERWAEMTTAALPAETGDTAVLVGVLRDITDRKRLESDLEHLATVDGLTGALNRRFFVETCERQIAEAARRCCPISLLLLDVDRFKHINDRYGHNAGDEVLRLVVRTGRQSLRSEDAFGRIGGDEFAVLLPGSTAAQAARVAERLRTAYAGLKVPVSADCHVQFTVSFGVAQWRPAWRTVAALLHRADQALYAAKEAGRNCVRIYEECEAGS